MARKQGLCCRTIAFLLLKPHSPAARPKLQQQESNLFFNRILFSKLAIEPLKKVGSIPVKSIYLLSRFANNLCKQKSGE
jgi:hypothetical protein